MSESRTVAAAALAAAVICGLGAPDRRRDGEDDAADLAEPDRHAHGPPPRRRPPPTTTTPTPPTTPPTTTPPTTAPTTPPTEPPTDPAAERRRLHRPRGGRGVRQGHRGPAQGDRGAQGHPAAAARCRRAAVDVDGPCPARRDRRIARHAPPRGDRPRARGRGISPRPGQGLDRRPGPADLPRRRDRRVRQRDVRRRPGRLRQPRRRPRHDHHDERARGRARQGAPRPDRRRWRTSSRSPSPSGEPRAPTPRV